MSQIGRYYLQASIPDVLDVFCTMGHILWMVHILLYCGQNNEFDKFSN